MLSCMEPFAMLFVLFAGLVLGNLVIAVVSLIALSPRDQPG